MNDSDLVSAADVDSVTFSTAMRGYDLNETDALLDRISETLRRYEVGEVPGEPHIAAQQVAEAILSTSISGYDATQVNQFLDWVTWSLRKFEAGHRLDTESMRARRADPRSSHREEPEAPESSESDQDRLETRSESEADPLVSSKQPRPMTSDELLHQARKWLDR